MMHVVDRENINRDIRAIYVTWLNQVALDNRTITKVVSRQWLDTVSALPRPVFVNLWRATERKEWARGEPGDTILFVTDALTPEILGFGMIYYRMLDYASRVWRRFGQRNGVDSFFDLTEQIGSQKLIENDVDTIIGNTIIINPVFFPVNRPSTISRQFHRLTASEGLVGDKAFELIKALRQHAAFSAAFEETRQSDLVSEDTITSSEEDGLRPALEASTWTAYRGRCGITQWKADVTLRVVFIRPVDQGGLLTVNNTMLLRSDLADLYHDHLIAFDEAGTLIVHPEFARFDSKAYREVAGRRLNHPSEIRDRPSLPDVTWRKTGPFMRRAFLKI